MGYWGSGSFENDYALNIIGEYAHKLCQEIESGCANKDAAHWDEYACDKLIVDFELFLAATSSTTIPFSHFPDPDVLTKCIPQFVARWKEYANGNVFQLERLDHVLSLWGRVLKIAENMKKLEQENALRWERCDISELEP